MEKLKIDDIQILGEGPQIKRWIESLCRPKEFYEKYTPPMKYKTFTNYLVEKKVRSHIFKCFIANFVDYKEIVKDEITQVKNLVNNVFDNIYLYRYIEDEEVLNEIESICTRYKLSVELAVMQRNKAKNFYYRGDLNSSIIYFEEAIQSVKYRCKDYMILFRAEYADMLFTEGKKILAERQFQIIEDFIKDNKLKDNTMYKYYYYRGMMYSNNQEYVKARELFREGLEKANINDNSVSQKGAILLNIGLTYKRENKFSEALRYYLEANSWFKDIRGKTSCLNNIAELHRVCENYTQAEEYLEKTLEFTNNNLNMPNLFFVFTQTLTEINLKLKKKNACDIYFEELLKTIHLQIEKKTIRDSLISIINLITDGEDLRQLEGIIKTLANSTSDVEYTEILYSCLGRLHIKIEELEEE